MESTTTPENRVFEKLPHNPGTHDDVEAWLEAVRVKKSEGFEALVTDDPKRGQLGVVCFKQVEGGGEESHEYSIAIRDLSRSLLAMKDQVKRNLIREAFKTGPGRQNLVLSL